MSASPSGHPPTHAVVIGGSTGAVAVLEQILPSLPRAFPAVLVVVHVLPSAPSLFAQIFAPRCAMRVVEPNAFEPIERGTIYFAPADYHLLVDRVAGNTPADEVNESGGRPDEADRSRKTCFRQSSDRRPRCALSIEPPVLFSRPSIDVLFESAAAVFGANVAGLVLTGANADGARGLLAIAAAGGRTFVQDPLTAEAPAMPLAALGQVPEARVLAPTAAAAALLALEGQA